MLRNQRKDELHFNRWRKCPVLLYHTIKSKLRLLTMGFHFLSLDNENKKTGQDVIIVRINTTFTY